MKRLLVLAMCLIGCSKQPAYCSAGVCDGCCDPVTDACLPGNTVDACGLFSAQCEACADGDQCGSTGFCGTDGGTSSCNSFTCSGCCDAMGACRLGTSSANCGNEGASCASCTTCITNESGGGGHCG